MQQPNPQANNAQQAPMDDAMSPSQVGILGLNNMTYKLPPDLSVCVQRNVQSSFFTSQQYAPGATMTCVVNSGSAYVNLKQSYLVLDVLNASTAGANSSGAWFGVHGGSAANFINRIQIIGRNGTVIERIDNANQLAACKVNYCYDDSWKGSVGSLMGIAASATQLNWLSSATSSVASGSNAIGLTQRFVIPLYVFSTFCNSLNSLCPAQLLSGCRFEILLESGPNSMIDAGATITKIMNYSVTGCRIDFESYLLTDSVMRVLNQEAASRGLEVVSATTSDTQSQRNQSQIVVDVARSCSRALNVIYKERPPFGTASTAAGYGQIGLFDPVASAAICPATIAGYVNIPVEWQARAGQLYFPQSSIRGTATAASPLLGTCENELYAQTLRAFQKLNVGSMGEKAGCNTSLFEFRGNVTVAASVDATTTQGSSACFALDLQRSAILTSGIPLSNSRQLSINYNTAFLQTTGAFSYLVDVFLTYEILVRVFLSNLVLEV